MSDLEPGTRLAGRYRLERLLGRGGMGAVYVALDAELGREVAVKLLPAGAASTRVVIEARAMARVEHPNVVGIFDVAVHDGMPFLVMERLLGESLEERWERGAMPLDELLDLFVAVCDGVGAAHAAGVVHRDLKPGNVFLCLGKDGSPRPPKVLDFGVAKLQDGQLTSPSLAGAIVGSPRFMAPEQLHGAPPTPALDVYAIGVMLYRGVTGRLPFDDDELLPLIARINEADPVPVARLAPGTPPDLASCIAAAMARLPAARPSLEALRSRLAGLRERRRVGGLDTLAAPASSLPPRRAAPVSAGPSGGARIGELPTLAAPATVAGAPGARRDADRRGAAARLGCAVLAIAALAAGVLAVAVVGAGLLVDRAPSLPSGERGARGEGVAAGEEIAPGSGLYAIGGVDAPTVALEARGCAVPEEGPWYVFWEYRSQRLYVTAGPEASLSLHVDRPMEDRPIDLAQMHAEGGRPPIVIAWHNDERNWDSGHFQTGAPGGRIQVRRLDVHAGAVDLGFDQVRLVSDGLPDCVLNGRVGAQGYTARYGPP